MSTRWCLLFAIVTACTAEVPAIDGSDSEADTTDDDGDAIAALAAGQADAPVPIAADAKTADQDGDGIPDVLEEQLLRRYRPFYRFSQDGGTDEPFRPADAVAELENAQLVQDEPDYDGTTDPLAGCGRAGDHHLVPGESLYTCRADASLVAARGKSSYALDIADARYHGVSFDEARANATGLYGHVAPATINGHAAYKIEYWQFFAFNNQNISVLGDDSIADHEGDWTSVQLWFDREEHRLAEIRYLVHGDAITFAIPPTTPACSDCTIDIHGSAYNPSVGNFFSDGAAYSNNAAQFYIDDHKYKHVVVYIEQGAHEFWPGAWGHASKSFGPFDFSLNPHQGAGPSYLVPAVGDRLFNMGDVGHPLTRAGKLILQFNGFWGATNTKELIEFGPTRRSPVGPALHCSWKWPDGNAIAGCEG
jgi:hypothetical protein